MKKFLAFLLFLISTACFGQGQYNIIATAYVQTTLSQIVVLNGAQQAAGNFTFTIDAHNGGGRAGQSDTASVKLQFYNSGNTLLYTASSADYSLPNPNAVCGNPCIDPAVPWTTMTVSSADCGGSCSNVAYVKVVATGIDGSYWAGDYGPWYKLPKLTVNGGSNILYNPEFGPSPDNVTAQGWTVSPTFGACQGAWGGSNACIVNSSGVPGTSTTGVTANMNGGGYVATAGTTSAPAGGTTQAAPRPTFTQLKFGRYQIADSQWNTTACLTTNTCQIYYKDPGVMYKIPWTSGQWNWQTGQYVQFSASGDANYPYTATVYNADGTVAGTVGTGKIVNMGSDYFFFVGNDDNTGQLFSITSGMNDTNGVTWTGTVNPTTSQVDTYAGGGSTTPLAAGESTAPTVVSTSTSNSVSTSSSTSNTSSVTVTRPTSTGNYTDGFVGTTTTTTTTTTPVTTTTYSDGTTSSSNGTSTTSTSTTYTITPTLGTAPTYSRSAPNTSGNSIYVKQIYSGSNTNVTLEQDGNNNAITGTDSGWATVDGNNSAISVKQFGTGNITGLKMNAWGNNIDIKQRTAAGGDVSNNIFNLESAGNGNAVTLQQQSNTNTASVKLTWDINTVNLTQKTGTGNTSYVTINGYWNTVNNTQNGSDNFSLINISGDNNSATVNQTGTGHNALLNLIGNKNTVSVTQTGTGDAYSLQQTCTNPAGCSLSVIRNK